MTLALLLGRAVPCAPLLLLCAGLLSGCVGPNAERNTLTTVEASKATVKAALAGWNEWLGVEYRLCDTLPAEKRLERSRELAKEEMRVKAAVGRFNDALASVERAWDAYDQVKAITLPGAPPPDLEQVKARIAAVQVASDALFDLVKIWLPQLKKAR